MDSFANRFEYDKMLKEKIKIQLSTGWAGSNNRYKFLNI